MKLCETPHFKLKVTTSSREAYFTGKEVDPTSAGELHYLTKQMLYIILPMALNMY